VIECGKKDKLVVTILNHYRDYHNSYQDLS